ncbi:MAG: Type II/IV secretion system protein TadC, associated with Flp pilus assembly [uncultured Nocardioidaceae bacterium]|uniref:Type II/IV secretion system protein TadC, associated with Flp pilus assembly n=1 Tax=uncultured Nocardioidaceae bacterium TaxID=253824 RepID=A0A6J4N668_9ACTN|nr:MAG: Type II/IV secretion system protein TadC, associated with Flp pilus assembly [uncultured Nocardioidaceae bacterium]
MAALLGGLLGAVLGTGLALVIGRLAVSRRPSLESRVAPYIRDVPTIAPAWSPVTASDRPSSALAALVRPGIESAAERLERLLGGRESIRRRLERAGSTSSVESFRVSQVLWGLGGFGAALGVGLLGPVRQPGGAVTWLMVCLGSALAAILVRDSVLTRSVRRREQQIIAEFPVVADLLALAVAAGEGPVSALDRVIGTCRGALTDELRVVLAQSRTGVPLSAALDSFAARSGLAVVSRFAEGFAVAVERGTPLVDVLNAQAGDVREAGKRALIETGARKEIAMMIPVVFLIMPITLLFAFFPGVIGLRLLAP